ncbi:hypothetical protein [Planktosalinus lacus]|uniref:Uncharacterized protein n=1 Tax=Planktosalinus lacus TaxID=1526573 RepID=A0A8J2VCA6_9FLAO|nr:hypothetical protein [Planktosalinus lacus]GGE00087.1 hypothetical protein GCM10011312_24470 [Planktosalinus lacus]
MPNLLANSYQLGSTTPEEVLLESIKATDPRTSKPTVLTPLKKKAHHSGKPLYITDIRPGFVNTLMIDQEEQFMTLSKEKTPVKSIKVSNTKIP